MTATNINDMSKKINICAVQCNSQQDIEKNLSIVEKAVATATNHDIQLIVLPENVCSMGKQQQTAERFDELSSYFSNLADSYNIHLVAGTLPCPYRPDGSIIKDGRLRQASLLFAPDGKLLARYDKMHLFKATVDDATNNYDESLTFEPGTELVVAPIWHENHCFNLGMMVCFDLRFPAMAQRLRKMDADLLSAPAAFTFKTGQAHWQLLLKARALDSQCTIIGAAQTGTHIYPDAQDRQTWGHSGISFADGSIDNIVETETTDNIKGYDLITSVFDKTHQNMLRQNIPIFNCHVLD